MIETRRGLFVARWADTLRRERFLPSENLEFIHSAALRLLPHPRKLIIYDVRAKALPDILRTNKTAGHLTVYFLHSTTRQRNELLLKAGADVQYAFGNTRQLKHFIFQRAGVYDTVEASVGVSTELVAQLHKIQHLCSTD